MHFQSLFVFAAAVLVGQAAAQIQTVSSKCKQVPDCTKDNVGVACKVTCEDSVSTPNFYQIDGKSLRPFACANLSYTQPGGTRVTSGLCKNGPFGFSCTP